MSVAQKIARDFNLRALPYRPQWTLAASLIPTTRGGFLFTAEGRELRRLVSKKKYSEANYKMHLKRSIVGGQRKSFKVLQEDPIERFMSNFTNKNPSLAREFPNLANEFANKQLELMKSSGLSELDAYNATLKEIGVAEDEVSAFHAHVYEPLVKKLETNFTQKNPSLAEKEPLLAAEFAKRQILTMAKYLMNETDSYNATMRDLGILRQSQPLTSQQQQQQQQGKLTSDELEQRLLRKVQAKRVEQFKIYSQMKSNVMKAAT